MHMSSGQFVILVSTHAKAAGLIPAVRAALDANWPDRPTVRYLTDGGLEPGGDVYVEDEREFVPLMARGLARLRAEFPDVKRVFHMLEDHCPLRRLDRSQFDAALRETVTRDFFNVAFPTYDWPWDWCDPVERPFGERIAWQNINIIEADDTRFAVVPFDFFRYYQVQPTLWCVDYLDRLLSASLGMGIADPWRFESLPMRDREQHYVSSYKWPTVHHGLLVEGVVNPLAVDFIDSAAGPDIRRMFLKAATGNGSETVFRLKLLRNRVAGRLARVSRQLRGGNARSSA